MSTLENKTQQETAYEMISELVQSGRSVKSAVSIVAQQLGKAEGTLTTAYYRERKKATGTTRPYRRRNSGRTNSSSPAAKAVADAIETLEAALPVIRENEEKAALIRSIMEQAGA